MKFKKLLIALLLLLVVTPAFSQIVVVNKYQNVSTTGDIIELLVTQDAADLRGLYIKDFTSNNANDGGGAFQFTNDVLWSSVRAGTLIILRQGSSAAADITTSCTDNVMDIGLSNATYFTSFAGFDLAANDMLMIKSGTQAGVLNNIHTLRAGAAGGGTQWGNMVDGTRIGNTTTVATGQFAVVNNANSNITDYDLGNTTTGTTVGTGYTFGAGNNATNTTFINFLKGPISGAASAITGIGFTANWTALTGATTYYLDVSTASDFSSFVPGYYNINTGNVTSYPVTTLSPSTTYYFRVRGINATATTSANSCIQTVTTSSPKVTIANGDWANGAIWSPAGVPASTDAVVINHAVTSVAAITRNLYTTTTISSGASLAVSATYTNNGTTTVNGTFQVNGGGYANGTTAFVYAATGSTLIMNHNSGLYGISTGQTFWPTANPPYNVTIQGTGAQINNIVGSVSGTLTVSSQLNCSIANALTITSTGTALVATQLNVAVANAFTVNGILQLNSGGYINTNTPLYSSTSTLIYNTTGSYGVATEWTGNSTNVGLGTPQNVTIQNNTTVNMPASTRGLAGDLTISSGNLTLNTTFGADLYLGGNWTRASGASFTPNTRAVFFSSTITQNLTVSPSGTETFDFLTIQGSGTLKLAVGTNVVVNGSAGLRLGSINATSTLDLNGQTFTVTGGGTSNLAGNPRKITSSIAYGSFVVTSNLFTFAAGGVSGSLLADNNTIVKLQNGLNCGANVFTIYGTLEIDSGGYIATNSPKYGSASTLIYNSGGSYSRNLEWSAVGVGTIVTTAGYPNNVIVQNNTNLDYNNGTPNAKAMNGNLTIAGGSTFDMSVGTPGVAGDLTVAGTVTNGGTFTFAPVASAVVVGGDFTNSGTVTLGTVSGADLKLAANLINTGTFNGNNRAVFFTKAGTQTVSSTTALTIPYLITSGGGTTVQLLSSLTVSAPLVTGLNAISFGNAADVIDINGNSLTIGTPGISSVIFGSGTFKGSTTSNLTLLGNGSIGTLTFSSNLNLGTFTVNRTSGAVACVMGSSIGVANGLVLTAGIVDLANTAMTLGAAGTITGGSSLNYVIADVANGSTASLLKTFSSAGSFTYPIGDSAGSANGSQYSPVSVTFTGGTYGGYAGFAVDDIKEPNMDASVHYITRYWSLLSSGLAPSSYSVTGTYLPVDIVGTESSSQSNQWNGTAWTNGGTALGSNTLTKTGNTTLPVVNHFSGGNRDPEINVQQAGTTYLTASTFDFGTVVTTSPSSLTFTIQNLGSQTLTLTAATFTGSPNYTYTTAYATSVTGLSSVTFVVTFNPTGAGTFTGSISIPNNDTSGGENPYVINFTGVGQLPAAEINIRAASGGFGSITSGNISTTNGLQNTAFGSVNIGSSTTKDFEIQNLGSSVLTLSGAPLVSIGGANPGDFTVTTVPATSSIAAGSSTTFIITFTPTFAGTRSAIVSIANNDSNENPYTYLINGTGVCLATANTVTPTSGPVGTIVTITATSNNLTGAQVSFNGTTGIVTPVSSTQIKVVVPSGATNGNLITTNSQGCTAANGFTVLNNLAQPCDGGYSPTDLFISEFTDSNTGGLSYVELYNGTGVSKNLSNYSLQVANNGGAYSSTIGLSNVSLASGSTYVIALGNDGACATPGGDGSYAAQSTGGSSVNFPANGDDHVALFNGVTQIDSWGVFGNNTWASALSIGTEGVDFRRKTTVVAPNTTYNNSDWTIIDYAGTGICANNDYSNIGVYSMSAVSPPTVTLHPVYTPTCKATTLTVAGTEGFVGGNTLAYQWFAVAPSTAAWTSLTDVGVYTGTATATLTISDVSSLTGYQFYCQIRENSATCYAASNAVMITAGQSTTWTSSWSNGAPTTNTAVVINGNYDTSVQGSFDACSVTVNGGFTLDVKSGNYVSIQNDLTVAATGNLIVENNGSLVMINDNGVVTNNGTTQVIRTTSPFEKYDYTYWSSPVNNTSIASTFAGWRTDYSFDFVTPNYSDTVTINSSGTVTSATPDSFDDYAPWAWQNFTGTMTNGKGYAIMGPTGLAFTPSATSTVTFSGKVNNGIIPVTVYESGNLANTADDYNLVGNPYPSSVFADKFITDNGANTSGTLYFWTHIGNVSASNLGPSYANFITADYAVYNLSGGTASGTGSAKPLGYIASGQGFFVEAQNNNVSLLFNNSMRSKTYGNSQFYRAAATAEKDRIWLNVQNADGLMSQLLVAYFDNATLGFDWGYDGKVNLLNTVLSFYSLSDNEQYKIQARPTFTDADIVPLGYFSAVSGDFTISIDQMEGVLNSAATSVYIQDLDTNIIHDLKQAPYTFTTATGTFENRFLLRYTTDALGGPDFETLNNSVVVSGQHGSMAVHSYLDNLQEITVYDMLGRQLYTAQNIGAKDFSAVNVTNSQQALIVKIKLVNGTVVTRKIVL